MLSSHPCPQRLSFTLPLRASPPPLFPHPRPRFCFGACHANQPFNRDSISSASLALSQSGPQSPPSLTTTLKIAIIGFGNFGQFLSKAFSQQGHTVFAYSRTDYSSIATSLDNTTFFKDPHDLCESHPDVVLLCTSILSTEKVLRSIPIQRLRRSTLFADVLSVKEFPRSIFLDLLPPDFDILCTHPMFGPESGKYGWNGLPFVYDKVRIGDSHERVGRCEAFLEIFRKEGCRMIDMSCKEHDEIAAESQFLTHTVGRVLAEMRLRPTRNYSQGYDTLFKLIENTCSDSFELYNGLFMYNKNSTDLLDRIYAAYEEVKKEIRGMVQGILRRQLYGTTGIRELEDRVARCETFLEGFNKEMSEQDANASGIHFVALTIGMILKKLGLKPTSIATKGYETLLKLVEDTSSESFDLYIALFMHIKNSNELLDQLDVSLANVRKTLYGRLHDILRRQLFDQPAPGMMPPRGALNPSQNVVMPSTDQPSTSRQLQGRPLIQGLANRPRIVPGGPFPLGMYSDTQRRQQKMQHQSQNQMQYQQQLMMHQAQQNLLALGGSVMMSAARTAGMSNAASAMGVQQMNNMTTSQKKQSESPGDYILHQQQLHGKQRILVGSCSAAPVDLTDDQPEDIYQKQEFLKKTHGMQLSEIVKELVSIQVVILAAQPPFYEEILKKITDVVNKLNDFAAVLNFHVDILPINLKDKLHRFEEFMPVVVEQAELIIDQGQHFLRQQPQLQLQKGPSLTATGAPLSHLDNSRNSNSQANP